MLLVVSGFLLPVISHAQYPCKSKLIRVEGGVFPETICNVQGLMNQSPNRPGAYAIKHGTVDFEVKQTHLNNLLLAFNRISAISNMTATLQIDLSSEVNAYAIASDRSVTFTNGLLVRGGDDLDLIAAVVGHELAHLKLKHSFSRNLAAVDAFRGALIHKNIAQITGQAVSVDELRRNYYSNIRAFSRANELEADKLGTEWISEAKFDPKGILRLINLLSGDGREAYADYMSTHPGGVERVQNAGLVVTNQQFDMQAADYFSQKKWRELRNLVESWQKAIPESARAYFYQGVVAKHFKRRGVIDAFENSVAADPGFIPARLALCIELFNRGELRASLLCAEFIPRGDLFEQYENATFGYPIHVGGFVPQRLISAQDVAIARGLCQRGLCR